MAESDPKSMDELIERFSNNTLITGFGIEEVKQHTPCPFCGAGHWLCFRLVDQAINDSTMQEEKTCQACGRSGKTVLTKEENTTYIEIVQTGGDEQPVWMSPKYRRTDREDFENNEPVILGHVTTHFPDSNQN